MAEDQPIIPPAEDDPIHHAEAAEPPDLEGEIVDEPEVPATFKPTKVIRLPEDPRVRQAIREKFDGPSASISPAQAGIYRPAVNQGGRRSRTGKKNEGTE